jgi:hypothetical protein
VRLCTLRTHPLTHLLTHLLTHALRMLCTPAQVVYLPVYEPSAAEQKDPALYARGVRAALLAAAAGDLTASELSLADKRSYQEALLADWAAAHGHDRHKLA